MPSYQPGVGLKFTVRPLFFQGDLAGGAQSEFGSGPGDMVKRDFLGQPDEHVPVFVQVEIFVKAAYFLKESTLYEQGKQWDIVFKYQVGKREVVRVINEFLYKPPFFLVLQVLVYSLEAVSVDHASVFFSVIAWYRVKRWSG